MIVITVVRAPAVVVNARARKVKAKRSADAPPVMRTGRRTEVIRGQRIAIPLVIKIKNEIVIVKMNVVARRNAIEVGMDSTGISPGLLLLHLVRNCSNKDLTV